MAGFESFWTTEGHTGQHVSGRPAHEKASTNSLRCGEGRLTALSRDLAELGELRQEGRVTSAGSLEVCQKVAFSSASTGCVTSFLGDVPSDLLSEASGADPAAVDDWPSGGLRPALAALGKAVGGGANLMLSRAAPAVADG
jgi:hypothetical protein